MGDDGTRRFSSSFPIGKKPSRSTSRRSQDAELTVFVGCGTSYNLALSLAALPTMAGRPAIAVPGGEWLNRPGSYLAALAEDACGRPLAQRRDDRDGRRGQGQPRSRRLRHGHHRGA